ncbi:MAG: hypothetical protein PHG02_01750 [Oscillospiraceae bacterium]|nr:hypothetical protein [Oscillospiraceae bacterium]
MVWVNYNVDCSGLFQGAQFEREISENLLSGNGVANYEKIDEREISKLIVQKIDEPFNSVVLGSSRGLQVTRRLMGTNSFFNMGMVGADFRDILGTFYLFDKADKLPKNLILCLDPWILNGDTEYVWDYRADDELYREFLVEALGMNLEFTAEDNTAEKMDALFDPSYFQGNVKYYFRDKSTDKNPIIVKENFYKQLTEVKMPDGSLLYTADFRYQSQEEINHGAQEMIISPLLRVYDYVQADPELKKQFEGFVAYAQNKGVNVIFLLTPYHPICYNGAREQIEHYSGFFAAEEYFKAYAQQHNITVYGSYNPEICGVTEADFYDGIHVKEEGLAKFFEGVKAFDPAAYEEVESTTRGEADIAPEEGLTLWEPQYEEPPLL